MKHPLILLLLFFNQFLILNSAEIKINSPIDGNVAIVIDRKDGTRVANLVAQVPVKKGSNTFHWNLKDEWGDAVAPGTYKWKAIISPRIMELHYRMQPYPNIASHSPNSRPWEGGPKDGWLSNHGSAKSVCAVNGRTYLSSAGTEGGHSVAVLNKKGEKVWGRSRGTQFMFKDWQGKLYTLWGTTINSWDQKTNKETKLLNVKGPIHAIAAWKGKMYVVFGKKDASQMTVYDIKTKKQLWTKPITLKGTYKNPTNRMSFTKSGKLFAVSGNTIVEINLKTMKLKTFLDKKFKLVTIFDIDEKDQFYVWDQGNKANTWSGACKVYDKSGKFKLQIGKDIPVKTGPYDPYVFPEAVSMSVDNGFLWLVYPHDNPRRLTKFKTSGGFVMDYFGNTYYGGGGELDITEPSDNTYVYYRAFAFKINLKTGENKLSHFLSLNFWESTLFGNAFRMAWTTQRVNKRKYFVNKPASHRFFMHPSIGAVWVYEEDKKRVRFASAFGNAGQFLHFQMKPGPWSKTKIASIVKAHMAKTGQNIKNLFFMWSDLNGNGDMDLKEITFKELKGYNGYMGNFDHELGLQMGNTRFVVSKFLSNGTPIYKEKKMPFQASFKMKDETHIHIGAQSKKSPYVWLEKKIARSWGPSRFLISGYSTSGKRKWFWPVHYGNNGLNAGPWLPGIPLSQLHVSGVGHHGGDLGHFFVTHSNAGQMNIWTSDGLLAGYITLHLRDKRAKRLNNDFKMGSRHDGLTLGQEHFHSNFAQSTDNKYYIIGGGDSVTIFEVKGWEKFKRSNGSFTVTARQISKAGLIPANVIGPSTSPAKTGSTVMKAAKVKKPVLDGKPGKYSTPFSMINGKGKFKMGYTSKSLVFLWVIHGGGPIRNIGNEFQRYFKTGSSVDVKLSTRANANHSSGKPVAGDIRILVTKVKGKRVAVLYRPIARGGKPWKVSTPAGGTASFQDVRILKEAKIRIKQFKNSYSVEMAVPFSALGMKPVKKGLKLKFDWGVYSTAEGNLPTTRDYWANKDAVGVEDEPTEARLNPKKWGTVQFQ